MSTDLYEVLQVSPNADPEIIEAAYHRLARKYHPDVSDAPDAEERMRAISRAYEVLRDADRRAAYDPAWEIRRLQENFLKARAEEERAAARSAARSRRQTLERVAWAGLAVLILALLVPLVRVAVLRPPALALLLVGVVAIGGYVWWLVRTDRV